MLLSIDPLTHVITIPQSELASLGGVSYLLNTNAFRLALRDWEDNTEGIWQPKTHNHNTSVLLGGIQYSRVLEILSPYTITFEETGTPYTVSLSGSNNNLLERTNLGTVQILSNNSAGLINVTEVQHGSFNGGVTIDALNGIDSITYPAGTQRNPCKTIINALTIGLARGFDTLFVVGNLTIDSSAAPAYDSVIVVGKGKKNTIITIDNVTATKCVIRYCKLTGMFAAGSQIDVYNCHIADLGNITLDAFDCVLSGVIELNNSTPTNFYDCTDGVPGSGTPVIQVNDCESLGVWNYSGGLMITNMITPGTTVSFNAPSGRLIVDATNTQGSIIARGIGSIVGTTGGTTITQSDFLNRDTISEFIWDEEIAGHLTTGSTGKALSDAGSAGNPWGSPVAGNTDPGTFGELVGSKLLTVAKFLGLK